MKQRILEHLGALVSYDTSKPAETMQVDDPIMQYAAGQLQAAGFTTQFQDLGQGRVNLVAKRGTPKLLLNCHLDTVPVDPKWTLDPFTLTEAGDKVHGLGSCDIKGAAACMLTAVEATDHDVAVLFNTDEEAGHGDCIEHFLAHRQRRAPVRLTVYHARIRERIARCRVSFRTQVGTCAKRNEATRNEPSIFAPNEI